MLQPYTYILINFFTVIVCFIASFDKRIQFHQYFSAFIGASSIVATLFICWDIGFTKMGVWWFNLDYTLGWTLAGLPIEEWLFFYCIPFACIFTYYCLDKFFDFTWTIGFNNIIVFVSVITCSVVALLHHDKIYTLLTAIITVITLIYLHFYAHKTWISQASITYVVLMIGFFSCQWNTYRYWVRIAHSKLQSR
jgi:lycopene cyclase domain-containing protein